MRELDFINYENCITNLANSILKKFNVCDEKEKSLSVADKYLEKDYKNVVVLLLDALGMNIIEKNLKKEDFFKKNLITEYRSVYPPTTVAATTAILSAKNPCETGWLGWDCFIPQVGESVEMFTNNKTGTHEPVSDKNIAWEYFGYENIIDKINKDSTKGAAYMVTPFVSPYPDSFDKIIQEISELCRKPGNKYIYAYWNEPDSTMHKYGCFGSEAKTLIKELQDKVELFCEDIEDTIVFVTADHGHIDTKNYCIHEFPSIDECLVRCISIEPRTLNLFVKEDMRQQFVSEFNKYFGDSFILMTRDDVIEKKIFGTGNEHKCFREMLGDYIAFAINEKTIFNTYEEKDFFIGGHAGLTMDEMRIPLIVIERGRRV